MAESEYKRKQQKNKLTSTKHAANVGMPLVKTFMYNRIDEQRAVEQQPLVLLAVVLFSDLLALVLVALQQLFVSDFLNLSQHGSHTNTGHIHIFHSQHRTANIKCMQHLYCIYSAKCTLYMNYINFISFLSFI